ncbi:aminomethyl-transferring glycine dehydrogenase subunit GcvPA [Zavarzinia sp. CC-PAN008]|uniref:aminomethyl-transferring glycine dehydrogenase subunit GcvPA n=1 Tax=Zavarzinia sp. CC-PAN008 TaxID=3243332 RepID=UPI003F746438
MRYLPLTEADRGAMLARVGVGAIDDLFTDVPAGALLAAPVDLPRAAGELAVERTLTALARRNLSAGEVPSFLGCGAYRHHVPAAVDHLIQRGEFLTSYTPYQPEIAQGTLQYLFEFQTQVALLTGMDVANASMYDGATAAAEAVLMARRVTRRTDVVLAGNLHPHYAATIRTHAELGAGGQVVQASADPAGGNDGAADVGKATACLVVQTPDVFGRPVDLVPLAEAAHAVGALLVVVVTEVVALGLLEPPGAQGADIVVGEGQGLGVGLNFGGPHLGLFATRDKYVRQMPGRLAGATVDAAGRPGFVLTLSAREQHIRREKATSNICTNSGLCALAFTIHLSLLGEAGLTRLARLNHEAACRLADRLEAVKGVRLATPAFFNELTVRLGQPAGPVVDALAQRGVLAGVPGARLWPGAADLDDVLILAATELTTDEDMDALVASLSEVLA